MRAGGGVEASTGAELDLAQLELLELLPLLLGRFPIFRSRPAAGRVLRKAR
jgi:hypothetical protein